MRKKKYAFLLLACYLAITLPLISIDDQNSTTKKDPENHPSLPILIGVVLSQGNLESLAFFKEEKTGKITMLKVGEKISGLTLAQVFENRVTFQKGEETFQVFIGRSTLTKTAPENQKITGKNEPPADEKTLPPGSLEAPGLIKKEFIRSDVEQRVEVEWDTLLKETQVVPNYVEGKIKGFKVVSMPDKGIAADSGIHKDDIIREINGVELKDWSTLFSLYSQMKDESRFTVSVEREGKIIRLVYTLK